MVTTGSKQKVSVNAVVDSARRTPINTYCVFICRNYAFFLWLWAVWVIWYLSGFNGLPCFNKWDINPCCINALTVQSSLYISTVCKPPVRSLLNINMQPPAFSMRVFVFRIWITGVEVGACLVPPYQTGKHISLWACLCTEALSCWNRKGPSPNSCRKAGSSL